MPLPAADTSALVRATLHRLSRGADCWLRPLVWQLRRAVTSLPELGGGAGGREPPLVTQALSLLRFATARGLATGRHPRALAAAALCVAAEAAGAKLALRDAATALCASADTTALRLAELRDALVSFAQAVLPWGADVTLGTLQSHLAFTLSALAATAHDADDAAIADAGTSPAARGKRRVAHDPPSYARSVAERDRVADKVAAAQARISGADALALVTTAEPARLALTAGSAVEAQLALCPQPPPLPRGTKKMRPLGGNARRPRMRPAAAAAGSVASRAPELDAEDAEIESLLRAGVAPVRFALTSQLALFVHRVACFRRRFWCTQELPVLATR